MKSFNLFFAALLCLTLCACGSQAKGGGDTPPPAVTVPTDWQMNDDAEVAVHVKAGREQTFTCTDKNKNTVSCTYSLPALTDKTDGAKAVNADISAKYDGLFAKAQEAAAQNKMPEPESIRYSAYVNDDIVTLVITGEGQGHNLSYNVYNYNKATGKQLDNAALLQYLQRDYDKTFAALSKALEADYVAKFKPENFPDDYYYQLDLTVGDEGIKQSQLFLNSEAELYAVCTEHAGVGNGTFQVLIRC